jgi:hypothetical protein
MIHSIIYNLLLFLIYATSKTNIFKTPLFQSLRNQDGKINL